MISFPPLDGACGCKKNSTWSWRSAGASQRNTRCRPASSRRTAPWGPPAAGPATNEAVGLKSATKPHVWCLPRSVGPSGSWSWTVWSWTAQEGRPRRARCWADRQTWACFAPPQTLYPSRSERANMTFCLLIIVSKSAPRSLFFEVLRSCSFPALIGACRTSKCWKGSRSYFGTEQLLAWVNLLDQYTTRQKIGAKRAWALSNWTGERKKRSSATIVYSGKLWESNCETFASRLKQVFCPWVPSKRISTDGDLKNLTKIELTLIKVELNLTNLAKN